MHSIVLWAHNGRKKIPNAYCFKVNNQRNNNGYDECIHILSRSCQSHWYTARSVHLCDDVIWLGDGTTRPWFSLWRQHQQKWSWLLSFGLGCYLHFAVNSSWRRRERRLWFLLQQCPIISLISGVVSQWSHILQCFKTTRVGLGSDLCAVVWLLLFIACLGFFFLSEPARSYCPSEAAVRLVKASQATLPTSLICLLITHEWGPAS